MCRCILHSTVFREQVKLVTKKKDPFSTGWVRIPAATGSKNNYYSVLRKTDLKCPHLYIEKGPQSLGSISLNVFRDLHNIDYISNVFTLVAVPPLNVRIKSIIYLNSLINRHIN